MRSRSLSCSRKPGKSCVLGAMVDGAEVIYEIDPTRGRSRTVAKIPGRFAWDLDLSPDGNQIIAVHDTGDVISVDVATGELTTLLNERNIVFKHVRWPNTEILMVVPGKPAGIVWQSLAVPIDRLVVADSGKTIFFRASAKVANLWLHAMP